MTVTLCTLEMIQDYYCFTDTKRLVFLINRCVRNENCIIYDAVVTFTVFIPEHPKNKGHRKPTLSRTEVLDDCQSSLNFEALGVGAPLFF